MNEETREIYERSQFGHTLTRGKRPAVLVVDFIYGFTDPQSTIGSDLGPEVAATRTVADAARERGYPVIFTTIGFEANLLDAGIWLQKAPGLADQRIGSRAVEVDRRLDPQPGESVVLKKGASAFFGTNLAAILLSQGVDTVILCGATTSGCIRATAVDLLQLGFPTLVPRECVGDRAKEPHEANLFDINAKYADVVSVNEVLEYLASTSAR